MPQVNCGDTGEGGVAAESRPARLRSAFQEQNALKPFAIENICLPETRVLSRRFHADARVCAPAALLY